MSTNPSPSPTLGNTNSIFFSGSSEFGKSSALLNRNRSPSPSPNISIKIDHAEETGRYSDHDFQPNGSPKKTKQATGNGGAANKSQNRKSRRDNHFLKMNAKGFQNIYMSRSFESDRELIRRQHAMIALQPLTKLEEIDLQRDLLRMKVENRKRTDVLMSSNNSRANTSLGLLTAKSTPASRTPSPSPRKEKAQISDYQVSKRLADSTSQAIKVTKKVVNPKRKDFNNSKK